MTIDSAKLRRNLLLLPLAASAVNIYGADKRPNIILFMVDDMGWQDTSVPFADSITANNRKYLTPAMERLAASGVKFTSAYASAISSPSRCSLFTGANAARHRVTNWTLHRDQTTDGASQTLVPPAWNYNGISQTPGINNTYVATSFVDRLRQTGYHTIHVGKAHLGAIDTPGENPHHFGFEVNITGSAAGGLATYLSERNYGHDSLGNPVSPFAIEGLDRYWGTGVFATEALTREAVKALDKAKAYNQPWFLYMSHYAVHVPIDRDKRFYNKHIARGLDPREAAYASLVEGMDKSLGDILDWVEANGEADNTVIIFMSDNGGYSASNDWRAGEIHTQNAPLRGGKGSLLEGGVREPMIVRWPGHTRPGTAIDENVIIEDFYPTILEMAGITPPDTIDGRSFVPLIEGTGDPSQGRALIWNYPNHWGMTGPAINFNCAINKDGWKLIYDYETGAKQLYNLEKDPYEKVNLVQKERAKAKEMSKALGDALRAMDAQRPSFKATGKPCPWPDEL